MADFSQMRLGRRAPRADPRIFRLARYLPAPLATPPTSCDWSGGRKTWDMLGNDLIGDCGIVAPADALTVLAAAAGSIVAPTTAEIEGVYSAVTGYVSGNDATDQGTVETDFLTWWLNSPTGFIGQKLVGWASIDPTNQIHVKQAIELLATPLFGINLPLTSQTQEIWDVTGALVGAAEPGSWGGHEVCAIGYNEIGPVVITWGALMQMTWAFFAAYVQDIDVPVVANLCPGHLAQATLLADADALRE